METRVQRWGNSLAIRIPKPLADEIGLQNNSPVQISLRDKALVVVPVRNPTLSLDALLAQVTPNNLHGEVQTGSAVGGEAW
jgi:antitoxin MazE